MNAWDYFQNRVVVTQAGCWEWQRCRDASGYGRLTFEQRTWLAHRFAWYLETGAKPGDLCVLHECDNPPCCNPAHLHLGTLAENNREMYERGRQKQYLPIEAWGDVSRRYRYGNETQAQIAASYGVHRTTVALVLKQLGAQKYKRDGLRGKKASA